MGQKYLINNRNVANLKVVLNVYIFILEDIEEYLLQRALRLLQFFFLLAQWTAAQNVSHNLAFLLFFKGNNRPHCANSLDSLTT